MKNLSSTLFVTLRRVITQQLLDSAFKPLAYSLSQECWSDSQSLRLTQQIHVVSAISDVHES